MTEVEVKTSMYWRVSSAYNGRTPGGTTMCVGDAINLLADSLEELSPYRRIAQAISKLTNVIIVGEPRRNEQTQ